jgi:hypothetical protein
MPMPKTKRRKATTSLRAEHEDLRARMRAQGLGREEIAVEFARRYRLRPRAAFRHAFGWTLQQAAGQINAYAAQAGLDTAGRASTTASHLCEYEQWPASSDAPNLNANALSFKGHLAFQIGDLAAVIGLSRAAGRDRRVWVGQRAYDAHQEARAHAVAGETADATVKLDEATDLVAAVAEDEHGAPPWSYYYTPAFYALERGLSHRYLVGAIPSTTIAPSPRSPAASTSSASRANSEWAAEFAGLLPSRPAGRSRPRSRVRRLHAGGGARPGLRGGGRGRRRRACHRRDTAAFDLAVDPRSTRRRAAESPRCRRSRRDPPRLTALRRPGRSGIL